MESVNRDEFERKLNEVFEKQSGNRGIWDRKHLEKVKKILQDGALGVKTRSYYNFAKRYELLKIADEYHLIVKRKCQTDPVVYCVPMEDYYEKLLEAHVQTGHGGRDKIIYFMQNKWRVSRSACEIFPSCCGTCNRKKSTVRKGVVIEPIVSHGFNARVQVDLIDFQSCARSDDDYKWLLNYQDHGTKFVQLRPLKSKQAAQVADELSKIFYTFGAPEILQSDNGAEFTAAVINELAKKWINCKVVHGRPRYPQSQGSVERANADVENMLRAWVIDHENSHWSDGCYEVQWQKNNSKHRVINRTPYEAVFAPKKGGLTTSSLPKNVLNDIETEEDLEMIAAEIHNNIIDNPVVDKNCAPESRFLECVPESNRSVLLLGSEENSTREVPEVMACGVCEKELKMIETSYCTSCNMKIHADCGSLDLNTNDDYICTLCVRGRNLLATQLDCFERQKIAAEKMKNFSAEKLPELSIGDCVTVRVPEVDRGPLDFQSIFGIVMNKKKSLYKIGTKDGIVKALIPRTELQLSGTAVLNISDIPQNSSISLREAASGQSASGGQGYQKCNCRKNNKQCSTKRCSCIKNNVKCNSRCHSSSTCCNKLV